MRGDEAMKPGGANAPAREVELPQRSHDPNIHGKGGLNAIGEEEDAIRYLPANARQVH